MPSRYSRSSRSNRSSRSSRSSRNSRNSRSSRSSRGSSKKQLSVVGQTIRDILGRYLRNYVINPQNPNIKLSKANIKMLILFVFSTIKLDNNSKNNLYKILLKDRALDNDDLAIFHSIMNSIGIGMYPIVYDKSAQNMSNFVASNYVSILCEYNGMANSAEILFNVQKIVGDIFSNDNDSNIISAFRNDAYVLENVFVSGQKILDYINKQK